MDIDYILIKKMYRGDDDAFDRFIGKYYEDILRYCVYHCNGDPGMPFRRDGRRAVNDMGP